MSHLVQRKIYPELPVDHENCTSSVVSGFKGRIGKVILNNKVEL